LTPQQAKRFRWKKPAATAGFKAAESNNKNKTPSIFDSGAIDSFPMIRPHDEPAFRLTTDILKHRLSVLKREKLVAMKSRAEHLSKLDDAKKCIRDRFENQLRDWISWSWPINDGRERVGPNTPVPPVDGPYELVGSPNGKDVLLPRLDENRCESSDLDVTKGANVHRIWNSFIEQCPKRTMENHKPQPLATRPVNNSAVLDETPPIRYRRLSVFEHLSHSREIDQCRALPHILKHRYAPPSTKASKKKDKSKHAPPNQSEICWKALLLQPKSASQERANEWSIVRNHFTTNSRSHKVLGIVQQ